MTRKLTTALALFVSTVVSSQALHEIALTRPRADDEWKVISLKKDLPIYAANQATSNLVGMKPAGAVLHGRREGGWLKLAKEPGYIHLPDENQEGVVVEQQAKKLIRRERKKAEAYHGAKAQAEETIVAKTKNKMVPRMRMEKKRTKTTTAQKIPHALVRSVKENVHATGAGPAKAASAKAVQAEAAPTRAAPAKVVAAKKDPQKAAPAQEVQKVAQSRRAAAAKVGVDQAALSKTTEAKAAADKAPHGLGDAAAPTSLVQLGDDDDDKEDYGDEDLDECDGDDCDEDDEGVSGGR